VAPDEYQTHEVGVSGVKSFAKAKQEFLVQFWTEVYKLTGGNVTNAAKLTGTHRSIPGKYFISLNIRTKPRAYGNRGKWDRELPP
jgi:hypothetical protein